MPVFFMHQKNLALHRVVYIGIKPIHHGESCRCLLTWLIDQIFTDRFGPSRFSTPAFRQFLHLVSSYPKHHFWLGWLSPNLSSFDGCNINDLCYYTGNGHAGCHINFYQTLYLLLPTGKKLNTSPRMTNAPPTQSNVLPPRPKINPKIKRIRPNVIIATFQKTYGQRLAFSSCLPCCLATALRFALSDWTRMLSLIQLF